MQRIPENPSPNATPPAGAADAPPDGIAAGAGAAGTAPRSAGAASVKTTISVGSPSQQSLAGKLPPLKPEHVRPPAVAGAPTLVLASASPSRVRLMAGSGWGVIVHRPRDHEHLLDPERVGPAAYVQAQAYMKARDVADRLEGGIVVAADTIVVVDGRILGKPADAREAAAMLRRYNGRVHEVLTGVVVLDAVGLQRAMGCGRTVLRFGPVSEGTLLMLAGRPDALQVAGGYGLPAPEEDDLPAFDTADRDVAGIGSGTGFDANVARSGSGVADPIAGDHLFGLPDPGLSGSACGLPADLLEQALDPAATGGIDPVTGLPRPSATGRKDARASRESSSEGLIPPGFAGGAGGAVAQAAAVRGRVGTQLAAEAKLRLQQRAEVVERALDRLHAGSPVEILLGSRSNVLGLPLELLPRMVARVQRAAALGIPGDV